MARRPCAGTPDHRTVCLFTRAHVHTCVRACEYACLCVRACAHVCVRALLVLSRMCHVCCTHTRVVCTHKFSSVLAHAHSHTRIHACTRTSTHTRCAHASVPACVHVCCVPSVLFRLSSRCTAAHTRTIAHLHTRQMCVYSALSEALESMHCRRISMVVPETSTSDHLAHLLVRV